MKWTAIALTGFWLFWSASPGYASSPATRHTTGPQTIRGTAGSMSAHGFTLLSPSKGLFSVSVTKSTQYVEVGAVGRVTVRSGDHVGVRGFVHGHAMTAMSVRVYPSRAAPATHSVRGTVVAIHGSTLDVRVGTNVLHVRLPSSTAVRIGAKKGSVKAIRPGDRIEIRLIGGGCCPTAEHVHVYRSKPVLKHVELKGTVSAVHAGAIVVLSGGKQYTVSVTSATTIYLGRNRSTTRSVVTTASVTVYACCAGTALTATSVHVTLTHTSAASVLVRGSVTAVGHGVVTVLTARGTTRFVVNSSTRWELGGSRATTSALRTGDYVSVRATVVRGVFEASRIHIYPEYRVIHVIRGVVVQAATKTISVRSRGKVVRIGATPGTQVVSGKSHIRVAALRPGQHVTVSARLTAPGVYVATAVAVRPVPVKAVTLSGVVSAVHPGEVDITDSQGKHWRLKLGTGVLPSLGGAPAPAGSLFPGVWVTAHGVPSGAVIDASRCVLHLTIRNMKGRVVSIGAGSLKLRASSVKTTTIGLLSTLRVMDAGKTSSVGAVHAGTFVSVHLYEVRAGVLRAASLSIRHPSLTVSGTVTAVTPRITVRTTASETYTLTLGSSALIMTARGDLALLQSEIPVGARVRVTGSARSDGTVQTQSLKVTLQSRELRGSVVSIAPTDLQVHASTGDVEIRLFSNTAFLQGTHPIDSSTLVAGDDVTVSGYDTVSGKMIARKITVHRRIEGVSGQIAGLTPEGFVLSASDGAHTVIVGSAVIWTGGSLSTLVVGLAVHVTGYRRGDGAIIATRVHIGKGR